MRDLVIFGGSSHPHLAEAICKNLVVPQGKVKLSKFLNGETLVEVQDSVREKDVFIIQSGHGDVNDMFIQLLVMIAACKTASAKRVTAVIPLFPYSRQPDVSHLPASTGAPKMSTPHKEQYTFESTPLTPRPLSRNTSINAGSNLSNTTPAAAPSSSSASSTSSLFGSVGGIPLKQPTPMTRSITQTINLPGAIKISPTSENGYKQWIAQNGTLIANLLMTAGADRIITMDLHDPQFQGFFNIPVDNLYLKPLLKYYITDYIPNYKDCVIVSPDSGGAKRATAIADSLGCQFALIHKERRNKTFPSNSGSVSSTPLKSTNPASSFNGIANTIPNTQSMIATTMLVGDVKDKVCILVDDLVDTSFTITRAAKLLKDQGARYVYALVTHGLFSGDAINRLDKLPIDKIITTNLVPQGENVLKLGSSKIEVLDVLRILAEAIRRIHNGELVLMLFDHGW